MKAHWLTLIGLIALPGVHHMAMQTADRLYGDTGGMTILFADKIFRTGMLFGAGYVFAILILVAGCASLVRMVTGGRTGARHGAGGDAANQAS